MTELGRIRLRAAALLVGMFAAGAAAGAGVVHYLEPARRQPHHPMEMFKSLGLTPDQEARAHAIMEKHRPELDSIFDSVKPRVQAVRETIDREIGAILTPEQAARFEEIKKNPPLPPMPGMGGGHHDHRHGPGGQPPAPGAAGGPDDRGGPGGPGQPPSAGEGAPGAAAPPPAPEPPPAK